MLSKPVVLTIIVNFNMAPLVEESLFSLRLDEAGDYSHHIVVWENGSDPQVLGHDIGSRWASAGATIWYLGGTGNFGYARAVNAAYETWCKRSGSVPFVVHCANPDTVSKPGALLGLVNVLKQKGWGAAAPVVTFDDGSSRPGAYPGLTPAHLVVHFLGWRLQRRFGRRFSPNVASREVPAVDGAYVVFNHEAWAEVKGLDSHYGISGDDADVCVRLRKRGWRIGVVPSSCIAHHGAAGRSWRPILSRLDEIESNLRYVSKFYPRSLPLVRLGIAALIGCRGGPFSVALAWWSLSAPVEIAALTPDIEENYWRVLAGYPSRHAAALAKGIESEWRTRPTDALQARQ